MLIYLLFIFFNFMAMGSMNTIKQESTEQVVAEGRNIKLTCEYDGSIYNIQWYRQFQRSRPEFLLSITEGGSIHPTLSDFSAHIDKTQKHVDLEIISAAVTDSAVYYCVLNQGGNNPLYFSRGTKLTVETEDEFEPYYYKLQDDETTVCLATGFSRHNATSNHTDYSEEFKKTEAGRISSPDPALYNQVIFPTDNGEQCEASGTESGPCEDTLTPDPMVNGVSFTIVVLRVIFLKTVVFDILMTMRLWISQ